MSKMHVSLLAALQTKKDGFSFDQTDIQHLKKSRTRNRELIDLIQGYFMYNIKSKTRIIILNKFVRLFG